MTGRRFLHESGRAVMPVSGRFDWYSLGPLPSFETRLRALCRMRRKRRRSLFAAVLTLRACDPMRLSGEVAGRKDGLRLDLVGLASGGRRSFHPVTCQDVVGECEPVENRVDLLYSSHCELLQAPVAEAGIDAFAGCPPFVDALAMGAFHAPAPGRNARTIFCARSVWVCLVLAVAGRPI